MEKRKISPWLIAFRILFTLGLIWTVFFIFSNSLQIAAESSARSQEVMAWVNDKLAVLSLGPLSEQVIRKLAHFAEYCLLGFFAMLCLRVYTRHFVRHISWPLFFCLFIANLDETLQIFVAGRSSRLTDVWIDFSGVLTGLFVALVILLFCRMCGLLMRLEED